MSDRTRRYAPDRWTTPWGHAAQRRGIRARRIGLLVALVLVLPACLRATPVDGTNATQAVLFASPVAAAELELRYAVGTVRFTGVSGTADAALVRAYDDGAGNVTVALVAAEDVAGQALTLHWEVPPAAPSPVLASVATYLRGGGDAGAEVRLVSAPVTPAASLRGSSVEDVDVAAFTRADSAGTLTTLASTADLFGTDLEPAFAHFPLGDLDQNDDVDVLDVLMALDVATGADASPTAYERYHADLVPDDDVQIDDVLRLLDKAVDPTLPASLVVRPLRLSYVALTHDVPVLVGNAGNEPFSGLSFDGLAGSAFEPIAGQTAVFTPNVDPELAFGALEVQARGGPAVSIPVGNITILVAGQSNAVGWDPAIPSDMITPEDWPLVRMLGNDYVWKGAREPLDDDLNQVDDISRDSTAGASLGVELGRQLAYESGSSPAQSRMVYLIPAALGGSQLSKTVFTKYDFWHAGLTETNRDYLFGSAAYRGLVSSGLQPDPIAGNPFGPEGGPVSALFWYQGESDSRYNSYRTNYAQYTLDVFNAFRDILDQSGRRPIVIYAQLASHGISPESVSWTGETMARQHSDIAERQRRLEQGAFIAPVPALEPMPPAPIQPQPETHMVVTHDLERFDRIHLSAEGQRTLAERVALAVRQHVLGESVDGTGPRIVGVSRSGNTLTIVTDQTITETSNPGATGFAGYFSVWDGPPDPGDVDSDTYGTNNSVEITNVRRHPSNDHAIQITLANTPADPYVRYGRPYEPSVPAPYIDDVVRSQASGLPLPAFGPLRIQ